MSVIHTKHNRENPYVQLTKVTIRNVHLSLDALGLWTLCMSYPDNWKFYVSKIAEERKVGVKKIYKLVNELIDANLCIKLDLWEKDEKGRMKGKKTEYIFLEFQASSEEKLEISTEFKKSFRNSHFGDVGSRSLPEGTLLNNEVIYSSETPCSIPDLKKTISDKSDIAKDRKSPLLPKKIEEESPTLDIESAMTFCKYTALKVTEKDFKIWQSKYSSDDIFAALKICAEEENILQDGKSCKIKIVNHAAYINKALKEGWAQQRENITINRTFAEELKRETKWGALVITRQYCRCKKSGNDWSFKRNPADFKRDLEQYVEKQKEAYYARKEKSYD